MIMNVAAVLKVSLIIQQHFETSTYCGERGAESSLVKRLCSNSAISQEYPTFFNNEVWLWKQEVQKLIPKSC